MKNQKYTPKNKPAPGIGGSAPKKTQEENKEPSVLDKLKGQIKKIKELKEKPSGNSADY